MRISIDDIKAIVGKTKEIDLTEDFCSEDFDFQLLAPLHFKAKAENKGEYILLEGVITTVADLHCDACLAPVKFPVEAEFREAYALNHSVIDEEGEMDIHAFDGGELLIDSELAASVLFSLPMRVLCREDCRGLCPLCGQNLNEGKCVCAEEQIDPRLAVLKNFKFDRSDKEV